MIADAVFSCAFESMIAFGKMVAVDGSHVAVIGATIVDSMNTEFSSPTIFRKRLSFGKFADFFLFLTGFISATLPLQTVSKNKFLCTSGVVKLLSVGRVKVLKYGKTCSPEKPVWNH